MYKLFLEINEINDPIYVFLRVFVCISMLLEGLSLSDLYLAS